MCWQTQEKYKLTINPVQTHRIQWFSIKPSCLSSENYLAAGHTHNMMQ